jgi:hypothetical protein
VTDPAEQCYASDADDGTIASFSDSPVVFQGGVVSAASGNTGAVVPGGIVALYGTISPTTAIAQSAAWPTMIGGVSVQVNGVAHRFISYHRSRSIF